MSPDRALLPERRFRTLLEDEVDHSGLSLPGDCLDRLAAHYRLLGKWNRKVRLIGTTDPADVARHHAFESLAVVPHVAEPRGGLLDIGSGNGFPAIPIKCALPDLRVVMMEPTTKKGVFLDVAITELGLTDTSVIRDRVDRAADLLRHGRWDTITMRAVAAIRPVIEAAPRVLRPGGRLLFMVGLRGRDEVADLALPPLNLVGLHPLPGRDASWVAVVQHDPE